MSKEQPVSRTSNLTLSDSQIGLSAFALCAGILAALVITSFRLVIEWPLELFLPMASEDDYESLGQITRLILLFSGGLILIAIFQPLSAEQRSVGVAHVLKRMEQHQGHMPKTNLILQWVAAAIALLSGHSVGREGPAIHLGAASASQLGNSFGIAHHHHRIIAAAGVASAISASFNTPMAGVIFAMEVVLLEYSIRGFIPIILASVAGAVVSRLVFGDMPAFDVPPLAMESLWELPYIMLLGGLAGCVSALFIAGLKQFQKLNVSSLWIKWGGLTLITGLISWWIPEILGIGYDSVNMALAGQVAMTTFALLLISKLFLASWAAAVGFPAGLIGPTLFIGAMLGGLLGELSHVLVPDYPIEVGFYTMLGMGALMGAVLRAPLAALVTLLELTANPNIILPAMLAIVIASLVVSDIFKLPSVFEAQMGGQKLGNSVTRMLRSSWVARAMDRSLAVVDPTPERHMCEQLLADNPKWLYVEEQRLILPTSALAAALKADETQGPINLMEIPAERRSVGHISLLANLQGALDEMDKLGLEWLVVYERPDTAKKGRGDCIGLVSKTMIEGFYRYRPTQS
ncbi:MAG: chloride channel protein [Oceanobacter sp.]